jgi:predicted HicB family RNase H-like nuclease
MRPLDPERSPSPVVGVRLPPDLHERVIAQAGQDKGALSAFIRAAVLRELDRAQELERAS